MSIRRTCRFLLGVVLAGVSVPLVFATPAAAADHAASVHVDAPSEMKYGEQYTISVTATFNEPLPAESSARLDILLPAHTNLGSIDGGGMDCVPETVPFPESVPEVTCAVSGPLTGSVTANVEVSVGPAPETVTSAFAMLSLTEPHGMTFTDSATVRVLGPASSLHVSIDAPDRVAPGQLFTVTVTGRTDRPTADGSVIVGLSPFLRFTITDVSAPGLTCSVRGPSPYATGHATCEGADLADSVTMTATLKAEPGGAGDPLLRGSLNVDHVSVIADATVTVVDDGSGTDEPDDSASNPPAAGEGTDGDSNPPKNEADRMLANTGTPTATLVGIGAALLAAGAGLTFAFRRRRLSRTTAG